MKRLTLTLELSGDAVHPMHAALDEGLGEESVLVDVSASPDRQTFLYRVVGDRDAYERRLPGVEPVESFETAAIDDGTFYLLTRESLSGERAAPLAPLTGGDVLLSTPVTFRPGGRVEGTLVGPAAAVQAALDALPETVSVTVHAVRDDPSAAESLRDRLTARQREALAAAVDAGYFDVPRTGSVEDVAGALSCSTGTASEHLRKAQATLARAALSGP